MRSDSEAVAPARPTGPLTIMDIGQAHRQSPPCHATMLPRRQIDTVFAPCVARSEPDGGPGREVATADVPRQGTMICDDRVTEGTDRP